MKEREGGGMQNLIRPLDQGGLAYNIFGDNTSRWPLKIGVAAAIIFHLFLFFVVFPQSREPVYSEKDVFISLRSLAPPPALTKPEGRKKTKQPPKRAAVAPKAKVFIPFPDPTPDIPEPLVTIPERLAAIVEEITEVVEIGEIAGPSSAEAGGEKGQQHTGPGGIGKDIYREGDGGVMPPALLAKELPLYTEGARRKRVEGLVVLRAIIDKNGRVTEVRIVKSLDPELDESAVRTVITKWRFRPATLNGQPVLFEVNFEIEFGLY